MPDRIKDADNVYCFEDADGATSFVDADSDVLSCDPVLDDPVMSFRMKQKIFRQGRWSQR